MDTIFGIFPLYNLSKYRGKKGIVNNSRVDRVSKEIAEVAKGIDGLAHKVHLYLPV